MILQKDVIQYNNVPLFSRFIIETPLEEKLFLPADACYLYIKEGDGHFLDLEKKIRANSGTSILSSCGLTVGNMVASQPKGSMYTYVVHFNKSVLEDIYQDTKPELWREMDTPVSKFVVQSLSDELVESYFQILEQYFHNKEALTNSLLELKLKEIVHLLLRSSNSESVRKIMISLFSSRTFTFKELVDSQITATTSIENLAQLTNTSLSTFKRKFQEIYDDTPGRYILRQRLKQVAIDLKVTDDPISQIGYKYGFESPEHLSRAFKKEYRKSPSSYRLD